MISRRRPLNTTLLSNRAVKVCYRIRLQLLPNAEDYGLLRLWPILPSSLKQRRQLKASCFSRQPVSTYNSLSSFSISLGNSFYSFRFSQIHLSFQGIACSYFSDLDFDLTISRISMEEQQQKTAKDQEVQEDQEENEAIELVLFQVSECYVYLIPPRKSAASYRADEWDVNKWAWEGKLKVLSKGEECIIRLEDKSTGELYARAFLRDGEQHPVEPVIDSSRYFVLRIEENIDGRLRHAFIGLGFRERTEAYDFQAALHDHMKYLNKKKSAEEMEQQFQNTSSVDYSLKDGETIVLQLKSKKISSNIKKSSELDHVKVSSSEEEGNTKKESIFCIKPPPPPPASLSPVASPKSPTNVPPNINLEEPSKHKTAEPAKEDSNAVEGQSTLDVPDDDFGDFQTAG